MLLKLKIFFFNIIFLLFAGQYFTLVPSVNAQQPWATFNNNLLNLFSDNFRNLLQQLPTSPLPTASLPISFPTLSSSPSLEPVSALPALSSFATNHLPPASNPLPSPLISPDYAYNSNNNEYNRPKDEILQYSDDDPVNSNNRLQQPYLPQQQNTPYSPYTPQNDYYNYQFIDNHQNLNKNLNQLSKSQFDDPLYNQYMLAKANLNNKKNLEPINLNKNVLWDDYSNLGLNLNAYNLDNIYNNKNNYNRLPVEPQHLSFVPPPMPNLINSQKNLINNQPSLDKNNLYSLQSQNLPQPVNNLVNKANIGTTTNQLDSAFSSFLTANKLDLSNLNYNSINQSPSKAISSNSVEQQYEQLKPKFNLLQTNEIYPQEKPLVKNNNLLQVNSLATKDANNFQQPAIAYPLPDLNKLYQTFASFNSNLNIPNNLVKNPSVIYYDNFIHHETQQLPISSPSNFPDLTSSNLQSPVTPATVNQPLNSNNNQLTLRDQKTGSVQLSKPQEVPQINNKITDSNSLNSLTTSAVAPNNLEEVTTQPQLTTKPKTNKAIRKKQAKAKRKNQHQQRDFGVRRKKDELDAIEK